MTLLICFMSCVADKQSRLTYRGRAGEGLSMAHATIHLAKKIMALSLRCVGKGGHFELFIVSGIFSIREFSRFMNFLVSGISSFREFHRLGVNAAVSWAVALRSRFDAIV